MGWMCPPAMAIGRAAGMLQRCCGCANAAALPMLLGAKQGQDVYLAGQLLPPPPYISYICTKQRSCSYSAAYTNVELSIIFY